ncbi:hypothetical protein [Peterkaempfera griseoplana]|uniref:hypothetical protein n=1 Tax=Peterkaempfera griseoplana TaxID=66896 RepID=UPI0006E40F75|nr:hypothetical protein [Peterkaempfera griseoplana]
MRRHQRVPLYDPRQAAPMRTLPDEVAERMLARRTCSSCGTVARRPLPHQRDSGGECHPCWQTWLARPHR